MQVKTLSYLLCRFFALYLLIQAVSYLAIFIPQFILSPISGRIWFTGFIPLVFLAVILFFWNKAEWIAEIIAGKFANQEIRTTLSLEDIKNLGFAFIGMFLLAATIPVIGKLVAISLSDTPKAYNYNPWPHYIELGLELIIGISLIFGSNGVGRAINKLRNW